VWSVDAFYRAAKSERAEGAETMELPIYWSELTVLDRIPAPKSLQGTFLVETMMTITGTIISEEYYIQWN
jgi:hypothetical protein